VLIMIFPFSESPECWVVQSISNKLTSVFVKSSLFNPSFPLVHCFRNNCEIRSFKEEGSDCLFHVSSLLFFFMRKVVIKFLSLISLVNKELPEHLDIIHDLVPFKHDVALSIDDISECLSVAVMFPLLKEEPLTSSHSVFEAPMQEFLFEITLVSSVFEVQERV